MIVQSKDKTNKSKDFNIYEMVLDFSSINDSKQFFKCFKNTVNAFKSKKK